MACLNEGLLSEEQRDRPAADTLAGDVASTKGCSRKSSGWRHTPASLPPTTYSLNEGLLSGEQRGSDFGG